MNFILMNDLSESQLAEFHQQAKYALDTGIRTFRPRARIKSLEALQGPMASGCEYYETYVMTAAFGRIRPWRAYCTMALLRKERLSQGRLDKFTAFERWLAECNMGVRLTNHGFTDIVFGSKDNGVIFSGLQRQLDEIAKLGYSAFANSGTLLGLVRDQRLIKHDDDIDLAVVLNATDDVAAAREFVALGEALLLAGIGDRELMFAHEGLLKLPPIDGFPVDLFPAYGTDSSYSVFPYAYQDLRATDVLPLAPCPVSGLPLPAGTEVLLETNYGAEWRTPDSTFVFPWQRQKKKFVEFLTEWSRESE